MRSINSHGTTAAIAVVTATGAAGAGRPLTPAERRRAFLENLDGGAIRQGMPS